MADLVDPRVAVLESGDLKYTLHDHLRSAAALVSSDGTVELGRYRPWGQDRTDPLPGSLGFGGQRRSTLTGLLDFDARFYDPSLGRFISADVGVPDFVNPVAMNRYAYAANNPMTYFDPNGEWGLSSIKNAAKKAVSTTVSATKSAAKAVSKIDPHAALDVAGMLPDPVGTVADLANAALYLAEGDYKNAAISGLAMIPVVGTGAVALRAACKAGCDKAVKAINNSAERVANRAGRRTSRTCAANSFIPGTPVLMADGTLVPIEDVNVGDMVWSANPVTGEAGPEQVVATIVGHGTKTLVEITTNTGTVVATGGHPFWVTNQHRWTGAQDIQPGDHLLNQHGNTIVVDQIAITQAANQTVHNLTITNHHTYAVALNHDAVLTHNCELQCDLHCFGNKSGPRPPRPEKDIPVDSDGMVSPTTPPSGASAFGDIDQAPLSGHYWTLPKETEMPDGLRVVADGVDVGGPYRASHHSIYPGRPMSYRSFADLFAHLPWVYGGKK